MSLHSAPQDILHILATEKLFGIVRTNSVESCLWASTQILEAGLKGVEIPFTVPDAPAVIQTLCQRFPEAVIGAGTILSIDDAQHALAAGAKFMVSPTFEAPLIQFGLERNVLVVPGAMTPTEIFHAYRQGALAIKVFPAESIGGAEFIKSVKGPFPHIPVIATGGIQLEHVPGYIKAGVLAMGVGGPLMPNRMIREKAEHQLKTHAQAYLNARVDN
jgi:2-dehydro-3-deoxyphosphogluconate aldolase / (4S)-4-hydroxy-2-oxoglutarate aldolase